MIEKFPDLILKNCPKELFEKYPKEFLNEHKEEILKNEELKLHFKARVANEFILKNGKKFVSDISIDTLENIIINLEFQSYLIDYERETIFNMYQAFLHNEHPKQVITIVFSMTHDKHELITHKINQIDGFTMLIISLKALNQKQTLNNILNKNSNDINLSDKEKALLLLSPIMDLDKKIEALNKTIGIIDEIKNLSKNEYDDIKNILWIYIEKWCKEEIIANGDNNMVTLTKSAQKLKEKFIAEGVEIAISAIDMIKNGSSIEDTSTATGLSKDQINQLCALNNN
jgi:hypothetical protein